VMLRVRGRATCDNLWLTSQRWEGNYFGRRQWGIATGRGHLVVRTETLQAHHADEWRRGQWQTLFPEERRVRHAAVALGQAGDLLAEQSIRKWGFGYARRDLADAPEGIVQRIEHSVIVPFWPVVAAAVIAGLWPAVRVVRHIHRRRRNRCVECGYDLRGSSGRCPECGTAMETGPDPVFARAAVTTAKPSSRPET
jgi:hypothetical protein